MDNSLAALCTSLRKIIFQLKPQHNPLAFTLVIGKESAGKSALLRQSHLQHYAVEAERIADIYYNQHGIILEMGESWLNESKHLIQHTLKQINRCQRYLRISGIILCVDASEYIEESCDYIETNKMHLQILNRFGAGLGYRVDLAVVFTKLDCLAGFLEFFESEHENDLQKPLGFSIHGKPQQKFSEAFSEQFDQFIEILGHKVLHKIHPARSTIKRTLIREFPFQLSSLRISIQTLLQSIPSRFYQLDAIYFTSAEQGGTSQDRLNKKIQHEYALTVQDRYPQSINYRAYFIMGALITFQNQTKRPLSQINSSQKMAAGLFAIAVGGVSVWLINKHIDSSRLLDTASKELLLYESMASQKSTRSPAVYHLSKASQSLESIKANTIFLPTLHDLKDRVQISTKNNLKGDFVPALFEEIEQTMLDSRQPQANRYQSLKIYLMLGDVSKFSEQEVLDWFQNQWQNDPSASQKKKLSLLKRIIKKPFQPLPIDSQMVSDVRNYLNALPANYLYYSLAKSSFPQDRIALNIPGFELGDHQIPSYFTKEGYQKVQKQLPKIAEQLTTTDWVLGKNPDGNLLDMITKAYCADYVSWWQNLLKHTTPKHFHSYEQARELVQEIHNGKAINKLVKFIQVQTSPELNNQSIFNQEIAAKFTSVSLLSLSNIQELSQSITELERFLTTLVLVNDQGKTAFEITKARFIGDSLTNPISSIYNRSQQLPAPVSLWMQQIADDTWFILLNDSRTYINNQWRQVVYQEYESRIAKRFPFDATQTEEVSLNDFNHFFAAHGTFNGFFETYIKPFIDTSKAQWQAKEVNNYVLPISAEIINELMRVNVISNMFFPNQSEQSAIEFTLQKVSLDPVISSLEFNLGTSHLYDDQSTESFSRFNWPEDNAKLSFNSIEGGHYELEEKGPWAFFKMLQKINVLVDENDSSSLQILFEINGNTGRYILKTQNQINPFIPGILNGFFLNETIV
jgi:intracellular multiplication protein IcmF